MLLALALLACSTNPDSGPDDTVDSGVDSGDSGTDTGDSGVDSGDTADTGSAFDCAPDHTALTAGVTTLDQGGSLPSLLVVHGEQACPVVVDADDHTLVAAAHFGAGRVLHAGHEGMITGPDSQGGDNAVFFLNALRWAGGAAQPTIGTEGELSVNAWLREQGFEVRAIGLDELATVDVYVATSYAEHTEAEVQAIQDWVAAGGGLVQGGHAWWWAYEHGSDHVADEYPGNRTLNAMGITVTEGTAASGATAVSATPPSDLLHAKKALDAIRAHLDGTDPLNRPDQRTAAQTVSVAVQYLPLTFEAYYTPIRDVLDAVPPVTPTVAQPVTPADQPIEALLVTILARFASDLPAEEVFVIDNELPGAVDPTAPRDVIGATILASYAGRDDDYAYSGAGEPVWRATGVYAPPGELLTVTVPADWVGQGLTVLIGAHTDTLWHLDQWQRHPDITRSYDIDAATLTVASAFGGPVYVRVPGGVDLGEGLVTLDGGVAYPRYVHGFTDPDAFLGDVAAGGTPIIEFESEKFVLTVLADDVAGSLDPAALMEFWEEILDADAALAAIPADRVRAERLTMDVQISAGWMHSGYPVMAYDYGSVLTDAAYLAWTGDWGAFHELGHNHQYAPLNLPGTTECTVNLWSVYDMETVIGVDRGDAHSAISAAAREATIDAYVAGGRDFAADWSVWTCLETYLQLQEAFGWEFYQDLHTTYLAMPDAERPGTDQERVDTFVVEASREAGRDLTPFFDAWGFPTSAWVADAVADLEPWTDHPMAGR